MTTKEFEFKGLTIGGFGMILLILIMIGASVGSFFYDPESLGLYLFLRVVAFIVLVSSFISFGGFMMLEPNEARALVFFGKYVGTFSKTGLYWVNPFLSAKKVSLRARNLDVPPIKVNDKIGNPILIGLVLVWKLKEIGRASCRERVLRLV